MVRLSKEQFDERVERIKNLVKSKGTVHYTEVAIELKCSPSTAIMWCKLIANTDKNFKYENGYLSHV